MRCFTFTNLDFFLLTSSLITLWNNPGQANYAAANTFLEAFCQYRRSLSLPCCVLDICAIDGSGFIAEKPQVRRKLRAAGFYFLGERELLDFLTTSIFQDSVVPSCEDNDKADEPRPEDLHSQLWQPWHSHGQFIMGLRSEKPLSDPDNRVSWRRNRRMAIYHNIMEQSLTSANSRSAVDAFNCFIKEAIEEPSILDQESSKEYLAAEIGKKVYSFTMKPETEEVDKSLTLGQLGLDSLIAIELRRWYKQALGVEFSVLEIMGSGTLDQLGAIAAEKLAERLENREAGKEKR